MKRALLSVIRGLGLIYRVFPSAWRRQILFGLFVLEGRAGPPPTGLRNLFALWDRLDLAINERAMALGQGEHPKHRLTDYHRFFTQRIGNSARVLDIGCGLGAVAASIAGESPQRRVMGIDLNEHNVVRATASHPLPNLTFATTDATTDLPTGPWDAVVLSNVLEHIDDRVEFLQRIVRQAAPNQILIRVPLFERHWHMPLRQELGVSYRSDPDHRIEHKLSEFVDEVTAAGLSIVELVTRWGEIWCACAVGAQIETGKTKAA